MLEYFNIIYRIFYEKNYKSDSRDNYWFVFFLIFVLFFINNLFKRKEVFFKIFLNCFKVFFGGISEIMVFYMNDNLVFDFFLIDS